MPTNGLGHCLGDIGDEFGPLDDTNWRVVLYAYIFEEMVSVKMHCPAKGLELFDESGVDERYRPLINTYAGLPTTKWASDDLLQLS